jgi:hypothetical protein
MLNILKKFDHFDCFGNQGFLEVVIGDYGSLEIAHIHFICFFLLFDCIKWYQSEY